jgi:hypothetical protein
MVVAHPVQCTRERAERDGGESLKLASLGGKRMGLAKHTVGVWATAANLQMTQHRERRNLRDGRHLVLIQDVARMLAGRSHSPCSKYARARDATMYSLAASKPLSVVYGTHASR